MIFYHKFHAGIKKTIKTLKIKELMAYLFFRKNDYFLISNSLMIFVAPAYLSIKNNT